MTDVERNQADLAWWMEVFGEHVTGWSGRNTATVSIPGGTLQVNARMREFFQQGGFCGK